MNYLHQAIANLANGARYQMSGNSYVGLEWLEPSPIDGGQEKPTEEEVYAEVARLQALYEYNQYQRDRAEAYPSIEEQLDLLYHGGLDAWKAEINKVKEQYPKPE